MKTSIYFAAVTGVIMLLGGFAVSAFTRPAAALPVVAAAPAASPASSPQPPQSPTPLPSRTAAKPATAPATRNSGNAAGDFRAQAEAILQKMQTKINQGADTEADFAPQLQELEALLTANPDPKSDLASQVAMMRAMFYVQILDDPERGAALLKDVAKTYPGTEAAKFAAQTVPEVQAMVATAKIRKTLVVGAPFPNFTVRDLAGKTLSVAEFKGKVVLVDFWATWCGPCLAELPNVQQAYAKYHAKGFDIIGISLDDDRRRLDAFLKEEKIPWRQFYDGKRWQNELAVKYGVQSIPASYLVGGDGRILAINPRGPQLDPAIAKALGAK